MIITDWAAVSPYGLSETAFLTGVRERASLPPGPREVPGFAPRAVLGNKGTWSMNRLTGLAIVTAGRLVDPDDTAGRTALVLGTTTGSEQSAFDFTRTSFTADRPYLVKPALIPYAAMNGAAGHSAIWHALTGPNVTVAGGRTTMLNALSYAWRLLRTGRADVVLCGSAEECSAARSALDSRLGGKYPLVEGCAMIRLTADADSGLATVLAVASAVPPDGDIGVSVASVVQRVLAAAPPDEPLRLALTSGVTGDAEFSAVAGLCPAGSLLTPLTDLLGEANAASGAFQLATVLSLVGEQDAGRLALVTTADSSGAAAALLRVGPRDTRTARETDDRF